MTAAELEDELEITIFDALFPALSGTWAAAHAVVEWIAAHPVEIRSFLKDVG